MAFQSKKPKIPKRAAWLSADPIYQRAAGPGGDIRTAWSGYQGAAERALGRTRVDYKSGRQDMATQRGRDVRDMTADFASRGLGQSGLYAGARETYRKDYNRQVALAKRAKKRGIKDITAGREDQRNLMQQQIWNARNEALLRRIQKYGLPAQGA